MDGEELKWRQLANNQLMSQQGLNFNPHSKAKANNKNTNSGRIVFSCVNEVAFASIHSEKTRMKKCLITINIIMEKKTRNDAFFVGA